MSHHTVAHRTIVVERFFEAPPAKVFDAYADVVSRSTWGVPSQDDALVYDESDFRVGGRDAYRCGPRDHLDYVGAVEYHDIVDDHRIVYVESVRDTSLLSVSLVTWELVPEHGGCRLTVTDQVASFVGVAMLDGTEAGTTAALDLLATWLADTERAPSQR